MLKLDGLELEYAQSDTGAVRALGGVSLELDRDEILGIVGESGCGKSTLVYSVVRTLPPNARITKGRILYRDRDLLKLSEAQMQRVRWRKISLVFQSSMNAFSPVHRIVEQLASVHMTHLGSEKNVAFRQAERALVRMGIPSDRVRSYPHEFSGGMRQRAAIALALLLDPEVLIADEPTTALDVVVQDRILESLEAWQKESGRSIIFVSHDISVVSEICDVIAVMYGGLIVERGRTRDVLSTPQHPYTEALLECVPHIRGREGPLSTLPGSPPDLAVRHEGCLFRDRCPKAFDECAAVAPPLISKGGHDARCLLYGAEPS